ncbi:lysozyme [Allosaccharopolyspora coralli]|uniref:lysozyme n=1 Tax=Allosaccharopolyspora coralli TaxID=2665642 RepID=UPI001E37FD0B|nr:lysozyme [Allosaccharopolyspora coralli]
MTPPRSRQIPNRIRHGAAALLLAVTAALLAPGVATADEPNPPSPEPGSEHGAWAGHSLEDDQAPRITTSVPDVAGGSVAGMDVSGWQGDVDWQRAWADGARFTYVKATEGTGYVNPHFAQQYNGSYDVGMTRGAYHYALPDRSSGAEQAHYFVDHGGGWTPDGRTLPGALDIEYNPYGETCYGLGPAEMSDWLAEFSNTYRDRTGRFPAIYTTTDWWNQCTGGNPDFAPNNPLWIARYSEQVDPLPAGWTYETIWQFDDEGVFPGDQNVFNGDVAQLGRFAG